MHCKCYRVETDTSNIFLKPTRLNLNEQRFSVDDKNTRPSQSTDITNGTDSTDGTDRNDGTDRHTKQQTSSNQRSESYSTAASEVSYR